jgi:mRNA-degrading endonuclease RelE of RelBE toxin-antitoxin system
MTEFVELHEFSRDIKKIERNFSSIGKDLNVFKEALVSKLPDQLPGTVRISNLGRDVKVPIYKVKHFRCRDLKGKGNRSGIRVIYAYNQDKDEVALIEIYYKGKKENEIGKEL